MLQHWLPLRRLAIGDLLSCGDFPAVYGLRDATTKDILKYGSTKQLRQRIFANYLGGIGGETTKRIHYELFSKNMIDRVEVSWLETKDAEEAKEKETSFRNAYKKTKGQRPEWDLQG